jgi:hypothetical protein
MSTPICRGRRSSHDGTDLVERHAERIMQNERKAFGGVSVSRHNKQRHADRVREHRFAFGIGADRCYFSSISPVKVCLRQYRLRRSVSIFPVHVLNVFIWIGHIAHLTNGIHLARDLKKAFVFSYKLASNRCAIVERNHQCAVSVSILFK